MQIWPGADCACPNHLQLVPRVVLRLLRLLCVLQVAQVLRDAASKLELLLKAPAPPPGGFLPLLIDVPAILEGRAGLGAGAGAGAGVQQEAMPPAPVGVKRARDGAGASPAGGPRKGGPGPRPMAKQQGAGARGWGRVFIG